MCTGWLSQTGRLPILDDNWRKTFLLMVSARKKILVTHIYPHLDEICAFWLFKRFGGSLYANAGYRFVPISEKREINTLDGKSVDSNSDLIHIGIAGGRFDEHVRDGGRRISSATLVRDFLKKQKGYPKNNLTRRAINMMVDYVAGEDNGETHVSPRSSFRLQSILYGAWMMNGKTDLSVVKFGMQMLDYIFTRLLQDAQFEIDWKKRIEFKTRWGKAVAIKTSSLDIDGLVYSKGFSLLLTLDPKENYRMFRASPTSAVNLTKTAQYLKKYDPKAHWYLHQSKKLLISGGNLAPYVALSRLTLNDMIKAIC